MSAITLEDVTAKVAELADLVQTYRRQPPQTRILALAGIEIVLRPGEAYAGVVLDDTGCVKHHTILMAEKPPAKLPFVGAKTWAASIGGDLPTRQEQALLFANCKGHFEAAYYWSNQEHEKDASCAWSCYFDYGNQLTSHKSYEAAARAVRRV